MKVVFLEYKGLPVMGEPVYHNGVIIRYEIPSYMKAAIDELTTPANANSSVVSTVPLSQLGAPKQPIATTEGNTPEEYNIVLP